MSYTEDISLVLIVISAALVGLLIIAFSLKGPQ